MRNFLAVTYLGSYALNYPTSGGALDVQIGNASRRTVGVTEPNGNLTTYGYDLLDNLTSVSMGNRTFLYSSLSHQICASNIESASNFCSTSPTPTSGLDRYSYDPNGNLTGHTDARGTSATMTYDGQNRVKTTAYSAGVNTAATPNVSYLYDADTKGTLSSVTTSLGGTISSTPTTSSGG
jgi:YD repeat-containing protein